MTEESNRPNNDLMYKMRAFEEAGAEFRGQAWVQEASYQLQPKDANRAAELGENTKQSLEGYKQDKLAELEILISTADDAGTKTRLEAAKREIRSAKSIYGVDSAFIMAQNAAVATSSAREETPEQKAARLLRDIDKLTDDIKDKLNPHMTDAERKQDEELERKKANAETTDERLKIEKEQNKLHGKVADRVEETGTEDEKKVARDAKRSIKEKDKKFEELDEAIKVMKPEKPKQSVAAQKEKPKEVVVEATDLPVLKGVTVAGGNTTVKAQVGLPQATTPPTRDIS